MRMRIVFLSSYPFHEYPPIDAPLGREPTLGSGDTLISRLAYQGWFARFAGIHPLIWVLRLPDPE